MQINLFVFYGAARHLISQIGYTAYIDEAGDDGIRKIRSATSTGASEWLSISAVVVKQERDAEVLPWLKDIISALNQHQLTHLHFKNLQPDKRATVCKKLAELPVRIFTVLSHKRNMEDYRNSRADLVSVNKTAKFYCWMTRLLLEEVTKYCGLRSVKDHREKRIVRIEFSDRGGLNVDGVRSYYDYIRAQSRYGTLHINNFDLDWDVVDTSEMHVHPNKMRAGLQLADISASAFYAAVERDGGDRTPEYAMSLYPRVAIHPEKNRIYGCGFKVIPRSIRSDLPEDQRKIIDFYFNK